MTKVERRMSGDRRLEDEKQKGDPGRSFALPLSEGAEEGGVLARGFQHRQMWNIGCLGNEFHPHEDNSLSLFAGTVNNSNNSRFLRAISERVISATFRIALGRTPTVL